MEPPTSAGYAHKKSSGSCLPPLVNKAQGLSSAALLTALLAAATFLAATAPLAAASLLLALALLAFTFLFIPIFLLATTAPLATLLFDSLRFDRFVRIALCFHGTFLYCTC